MPKSAQILHTKTIEVETPAEQAAKTELNISMEKVFYIIVKAREFDVKVPPVEPEPASNPADTQQRGVLEDYADDPTYMELVSAIEDLNEDEKIDLVSLVWVGRGDFEPRDFPQARAQASDEQQHVASYMTGTPQLGDLLEEGLVALGHSVEEFEFDRL